MLRPGTYDRVDRLVKRLPDDGRMFQSEIRDGLEHCVRQRGVEVWVRPTDSDCSFYIRNLDGKLSVANFKWEIHE